NPLAMETFNSSTYGKAVCHCFALEGATVAFTYVKSEEEKNSQDTLGMIKQVKTSYAKDPIAIPSDLGYDENCKRVVDEVVHTYGRIDVLVNNAAEQHKAHSVEEIDDARLERVFRTNTHLLTFSWSDNGDRSRHALKHMAEGSSIINITSVTAYKDNPKLLDYTSTKGASVTITSGGCKCSIHNFTSGLALQLVERGIRVNGVAPGPVWTPFIPASFSKDEDPKFGSEVPMKWAGQPHEIAPSYVFLLLMCVLLTSLARSFILMVGGVIVNGWWTTDVCSTLMAFGSLGRTSLILRAEIHFIIKTDRFFSCAALLPSSNVLLKSTSLCSSRNNFFKCHRKPEILAAGKSFIVSQPQRRFDFKRMASGGEQFPPQKQEKQPGKEYVMNPISQATNPNYRPSNKFCVQLWPSPIHVHGCEDKDAQDTLIMLKQAKVSDAKDPTTIPMDLSYDENCKKVVDMVASAFGRIDVLVNNAAEQYKAPSIEDIDETRLERVFRTNTLSHFFMVRHALKHMGEGSSIINTTSVNAYKRHPTLLDYTSTKGAIVAFTRRMAQPHEIAPSYVFLASNVDSSYFTGQVLHPNGATIVNA
ncbi:hypothetical protein IFM89_017500, partial [Coptis chinensis]